MERKRQINGIRGGVDLIRSMCSEDPPFLASLEMIAHLNGIVQHLDETDEEFKTRICKELEIDENDTWVPFSKVFGDI